MIHFIFYRALFAYVRLQWKCHGFQRKDLTLGEIFLQNVQKHPNKVCFIFEDTQWTFAQVEEYSNKVANVFKSHGYRKGDAVALFMENKPEFIAIWLGLSKLGVIVPLINTNLKSTSLLHSFTVATCQAVIFGSELHECKFKKNTSTRIFTSLNLPLDRIFVAHMRRFNRLSIHHSQATTKLTTNFF